MRCSSSVFIKKTPTLQKSKDNKNKNNYFSIFFELFFNLTVAVNSRSVFIAANRRFQIMNSMYDMLEYMILHKLEILLLQSLQK